MILKQILILYLFAFKVQNLTDKCSYCEAITDISKDQHIRLRGLIIIHRFHISEGPEHLQTGDQSHEPSEKSVPITTASYFAVECLTSISGVSVGKTLSGDWRFAQSVRYLLCQLKD